MATVALFFAPEIIALSVVLLALLVFLLIHIRAIVRNTVGIPASLLVWALEAGFVGFIAYLAAWVFLLPVMLGLCLVGGLLRMWAERRLANRLAEGEADRFAIVISA